MASESLLIAASRYVVYGRKPYPGEQVSSHPSDRMTVEIEDGVRVGTLPGPY